MYRHISYWHLLALMEGIALVAGLAVTTALWLFEKFVMPGALRIMR